MGVLICHCRFDGARLYGWFEVAVGGISARGILSAGSQFEKLTKTMLISWDSTLYNPCCACLFGPPDYFSDLFDEVTGRLVCAKCLFAIGKLVDVAHY